MNVKIEIQTFTTLDGSGHPVLLAPPIGDPLSDTTDEQGEVVFEDLPAGDYTLLLLDSGAPAITLRVPHGPGERSAFDLIEPNGSVVNCGVSSYRGKPRRGVQDDLRHSLNHPYAFLYSTAKHVWVFQNCEQSIRGLHNALSLDPPAGFQASLFGEVDGDWRCAVMFIAVWEPLWRAVRIHSRRAGTKFWPLPGLSECTRVWHPAVAANPELYTL